jgi:hypothetical protein
MIARGAMLGPDQPVILHMLDIEPAKQARTLPHDCAPPPPRLLPCFAARGYGDGLLPSRGPETLSPADVLLGSVKRLATVPPPELKPAPLRRPAHAAPLLPGLAAPALPC